MDERVDLRFGDRRGSHGMYKSPEHKIWRKIKERCFNQNCPAYERYGGRGISICESWANSFSEFYEYIGPRPSPKHTIERINNDGNYEPGNIRWATRKDQARNRSSSRILTLNGRSQSLAAWAEELSISESTLLQRVNRLGWSDERALTTPPRSFNRRGNRKITYNGESLTAKQWSERTGIPLGTVWCRLRVLGWDPERALTTPVKSQ